jgi:hypothetical protein
MGTFGVRSLAAHCERPVSYEDARRFRAVLVVLISLVAIVSFAWMRTDSGVVSSLNKSTQYEPLSGEQALWVFVLNPISFALTMLVLHVWLWLATGVSGCFFHPKWLPVAKQNRAVALSQYSCAPLALLPLGVLGIFLELAWPGLFDSNRAMAQLMMLLGSIGIVIAALSLIRLRRRPSVKLKWFFRLFATASIVMFIIGVWGCWRMFNPMFDTLETWVSWRGIETAFALAVAHIGAALLLLILAIWWFNTLRLLRLTVGPSWKRTLTAAVALPILWIGLAVIIEATIQGSFALAQILLSMR